MSIIFNHLFKISDLTYWAFIVLIRIFLSKALDLRSCTDFRNVWFLCATCLFVWSASICMSGFNKLRHLIFLFIQIFQHLRSRHLWSLSRFSKNLWSTFNHLLYWILSFILFLCLIILLIWIRLRNIISKLITMMMSMKIRLRITAFFFNWVMNLTHQLVTLMCSKTFIFYHASLIAVAHDSRWVDSSCFGLLWFFSSWSKSIFHGLHLGVLIEVEALCRFVSLIRLLNKLMWVSRISLVWSSSVVVA